MEKFTLINLPMSISINQAYKNIGFRGRAKSQKYNDYIAEFNAWAILYRRDLTSCRELLKKRKIGNIHLYLDFYFETDQLYTKKRKLKKLDVSNRLKVVEDLLCEYLGIDDSEIMLIQGRKIETSGSPHCTACFNVDFLNL